MSFLERLKKKIDLFVSKALSRFHHQRPSEVTPVLFNVLEKSPLRRKGALRRSDVTALSPNRRNFRVKHPVFLLLCTAFYLYMKKTYSFWSGLGLNDVPSYKFVFGNTKDVLTGKKSLQDIFDEFYHKYEGYNYVPFYSYMEPAILIRSPEFAREVLIKHFSNFHDTQIDFGANSDDLLYKNPFVLKGNDWKTVRNLLAPCYTGAKVKSMMPFFQANCKAMVEYIGLHEELEAKDLASKYTCDNVACCAFGLEGNAFKDPNCEFLQYGSKILQPSTWNIIKLLLLTLFPQLFIVMNVTFVDKDVKNYFTAIVTEALKYRKENKVRRNDFLDSMLEIKEKINDESQFGISDIVCHASSFFIDGFETSSVLIAFALYRLASNPEAQEKAHQEVREGFKGEYDEVQHLKYLDCLVKEVLRMDSPAFNIARKCTDPFQLPPLKEDNTGPTIVVEKGVVVSVPIDSFHMDEKYFPNARSFKPERWLDDANMVKGTYLPFGDGPRICIGYKLALAQSKLAIAEVIRNFEITVSEKTIEPLEFNKRSPLRMTNGGLWLNFKNRR